MLKDMFVKIYVVNNFWGCNYCIHSKKILGMFERSSAFFGFYLKIKTNKINNE